jgi:hypothetical protein
MGLCVTITPEIKKGNITKMKLSKLGGMLDNMIINGINYTTEMDE